METGLRNLSAAAKSAARRGEGTEEPDSGIGSSEAESSLGSSEEVDSAMADCEEPHNNSEPVAVVVEVIRAQAPAQQVLPPLRSPRRVTRHGPSIASLLLPMSPHT